MHKVIVLNINLNFNWLFKFITSIKFPQKGLLYFHFLLVPLVLSVSLKRQSTANGAVRVPVHTAAHEIAIERAQTGFPAIWTRTDG